MIRIVEPAVTSEWKIKIQKLNEDIALLMKRKTANLSQNGLIFPKNCRPIDKAVAYCIWGHFEVVLCRTVTVLRFIPLPNASIASIIKPKSRDLKNSIWSFPLHVASLIKYRICFVLSVEWLSWPIIWGVSRVESRKLLNGTFHLYYPPLSLDWLKSSKLARFYRIFRSPIRLTCAQVPVADCPQIWSKCPSVMTLNLPNCKERPVLQIPPCTFALNKWILEMSVLAKKSCPSTW